MRHNARAALVQIYSAVAGLGAEALAATSGPTDQPPPPPPSFWGCSGTMAQVGVDVQAIHAALYIP